MRLLNSKTIVQQIQVGWTKASRGAPLATKRNAVPDEMDFLYDPKISENNLLIAQFISFGEMDKFNDCRSRYEFFPSYKTIKYGCVTLELEEDSVNVIWKYNDKDGGMPTRPIKAVLAFTLAPREWGRITYNGRFSHWEGGWTYQKTVLNIGYFNSFDSMVFRQTKPTYTYDQMALIR